MSGPVHVEQSRAYPVAQDRAYALTSTADLTRILGHRHLLLPAVREVRDQSEGVWGSRPGATRTIVTSDGGRMLETLVVTERPHRFAYELTRLRGPMRPLLSRVEGERRFEQIPDATVVTWSWTLHPRSALSAPVVALIARMWPGLARRALVELEAFLAG